VICRFHGEGGSKVHDFERNIDGDSCFVSVERSNLDREFFLHSFAVNGAAEGRGFRDPL